MQPIQIKRDAEHDTLIVTWDDGMTTTYPIKVLRDECPCAGCKGETILGTHYPAPLKMFHEGMYKLAKLVPVGSYAIQAFWKDGHDTGLYSWDYLRRLYERITDDTSSAK